MNVSISVEILLWRSAKSAFYPCIEIPEYLASTSRRRVNCRTSSEGMASIATISAGDPKQESTVREVIKSRIDV
jgi:hypothetical protein